MGDIYKQAEITKPDFDFAAYERLCREHSGLPPMTESDQGQLARTCEAFLGILAVPQSSQRDS